MQTNFGKCNDTLFAVSCPTAITASLVDWLADLNAVQSAVAKSLAIISGFIAIGVGFAILRRRRYEAATARMSMCAECCKIGKAWHCGVPEKLRPPNCPIRHQHRKKT